MPFKVIGKIGVIIKASLSIILACTVSCSSYISQPSENKNSDHSALIRVNNEQDLYEAFDQITDTKVIELKNRIYNLDKPLILNNLSHITINGNGAVLVLDSLVNDVVEMNRCHNVTIDNIKALHKEADGPVGCTGNVILISGGSNITIINSELNGCGVVGVSAYNSINLKIIGNYIHKNTHYPIIYDGPSATIKDNVFENNGNQNKIAYMAGSPWPPLQFYNKNVTTSELIIEGNTFGESQN